MKLLVITPEFVPTSGGGIVTFYRHLLPAVAREGVDVTVLVGSAMSQPGGGFDHDGVRVIGLEPERFSAALRSFAALSATPALARHLAAAWAMHAQARSLGEFDVVEAVDWGLSAVPWVLAAEMPLLVRSHGSAGQIAAHEPRVGEAPFEALLQAIEHVVFARAGIVASYAGTNATAWRALLGREIRYVAPALPVANEPASASAPWSLVLGRVQSWKGPQVVGAAMAAHADLPPLRWAGRDVPDADAGTPSTLASMRARFRDAWTRRIEHHDTVSATTAQAWLREARVVLVPSTWDVFNFAGAEAMAAGAVVVASTGAGMSELIEDGRNGFLVTANDASALADAWRRADALEPSARARMGAAARDTVAQRLDPSRIARENIALWRETPLAAAREHGLDPLLRPRAEVETSHAFLSQYALRDLLRHVAQRLRDKVTRR
jgi:hypothetical protein